jgi:hypothetical protein
MARRLVILVTLMLLVAGCGSSRQVVSLVSPSAGAPASGSSSAATPTPSPVASPSALSAAEQVAVAGAVQLTGATFLAGSSGDVTTCPATSSKCLAIQDEVDGVQAIYFRGRLGNAQAWGECFIYTVTYGAAWHFLDMGCAHAESGVSYPGVGSIDYVFNTGSSCANVRSTAGLSGKVVRCLKAGTVVTIDGGPTYVVEAAPRISHLWWHLQGMGWMAHEYLILPQT